MNKEETYEVQMWVDYVKSSIVEMFKSEKSVIAHALVFSKNAQLKKQGKAMTKGLKSINNKTSKDLLNMPEDGWGFMHVPMEPMMQNDMKKDMAANILENVIKDTEAYAYAFISEAYSTLGLNKDQLTDKDGDYIRPSQLPDNQRKEIVMIMIETRDWSELETYEIIREDKEPWLYKLDSHGWDSRKISKSNGSAEGRFSGFLYKYGDNSDTILEKKFGGDKLLENAKKISEFNFEDMNMDEIARETEMTQEEREDFLSLLLENPDILDNYIKQKMTKDPKKMKIIKHDMTKVLEDIRRKFNQIRKNE